jgi:hypothetical protein
MVAPNRFSLDGVKGIEALRGFGYSEARHALPEVRDRFFSIKAESFYPIRNLPTSSTLTSAMS